VTALVGSGLFVQLDAPFVDVLIRSRTSGRTATSWTTKGCARWRRARATSMALGDRCTVEVIDAAILRRTVYGAAKADPRGSRDKKGIKAKKGRRR
jgi:ribonuclease R